MPLPNNCNVSKTPNKNGDLKKQLKGNTSQSISYVNEIGAKNDALRRKTKEFHKSKRLSKSDTDLSKGVDIDEGDRRLLSISKSKQSEQPRHQHCHIEADTNALINSTVNLYAKLSSPDYVTVPIIGYEVMEERERFTVYKLRIENSLTRDCWLVLRRYTDFVRLNIKLRSVFPQVTLQLPKKKIFGDNFSNDFLENRKHGLQFYINSIMNNVILRNHEIVKEFFCLDEPPTYSDNMEECKSIFEAQEETISHLKFQLESRNSTIINLQQKFLTEIKQKERLVELIKYAWLVFFFYTIIITVLFFLQKNQWELSKMC